tara:strand:- start:168 stop:395 length:228 start_codon:yes stop_codon:yes gene_type:complete
MRNLKIALSVILLGILSTTNFVAPIGDSENIKEIGVVSSNINAESRNRVTTNRTMIFTNTTISTATTGGPILENH